MTAIRPTASEIVTPEAVVLDLELAGISSRGLGKALDLLIQGVIVFVVVLALALASFSGDSWIAISAFVVFVAFVIFGYPMLFELFWAGRTPGMAALGLRVVSEEGAPISVTSAFARSACQIVDFMLIPGGLIAIIASLSSPRNQRVGDMVGGTFVLRGRSGAGPAPAVAFPPPPGWEQYAASLDVARLSAEQYQVIRSFLLRVVDLAPGARHAVALRIARPTARELAHVPPAGVHPEMFLVAVAAAYQRRHGLVAPQSQPGWSSAPRW
jgi:uncharacterized RDD family membrane protein YckC